MSHLTETKILVIPIHNFFQLQPGVALPFIAIPNDFVNPFEFGTEQNFTGQDAELSEALNRSLNEYNANKKVLNEQDISKFSHMVNDGELNDQSCSICMEKFKRGEEYIFLPCEHIFHKDCITESFKHDSRCPICRKDYGK